MGILTPPKKKGLLGDPAAMLRAAPDSYAPLANPLAPQMDEQPMPQPMLGDVSSLQAPIRKPGFFEDGGVGRRLAGTLGDTLATWAGGQAVYEPMMERRQALQHEQQVHDRDLQDALAQFRTEQQWKLDHPQPDDFTQRMTALDGVQPGLGKTYAQNYAQNGGGMPQMITTAQGTFLVPRTPAQPSGGPTPGTVEGGYRFKGGNASDPNAWEPVGPGGPMPSASGTFR